MTQVNYCEIFQNGDLKVIQLEGDWPKKYCSLSLHDSQIIAHPSGVKTNLFNVSVFQEKIKSDLTIENLHSYTFGIESFISCDSKGYLINRELGREWKIISKVRIPKNKFEPFGVSRIESSKSGKYILVKMHNVRALLYRLSTWELLTEIDLEHAGGHHSFTVDANGRELLFISAPSYMGIKVYECESARLLDALSPSNMFDFCHTSYHLEDNQSQLITFGCVWSGPYETRIYRTDNWNWLHEVEFSPNIKNGLSLDLIYSQENHAIEGQIENHFEAKPSDVHGEYWFVSLVDLEDLPSKNSEDYIDLTEDLSVTNRLIFEKLENLCKSHNCALISRIVRILDEEIIKYSCWGLKSIEQKNIHLLSDHKVMVVCEEISLIDAKNETKRNLANVNFISGHKEYSSVVSPDGRSLVIKKRITKPKLH